MNKCLTFHLAIWSHCRPKELLLEYDSDNWDLDVWPRAQSEWGQRGASEAEEDGVRRYFDPRQLFGGVLLSKWDISSDNSSAKKFSLPSNISSPKQCILPITDHCDTMEWLVRARWLPATLHIDPGSSPLAGDPKTKYVDFLIFVFQPMDCN